MIEQKSFFDICLDVLRITTTRDLTVEYAAALGPYKFYVDFDETLAEMEGRTDQLTLFICDEDDLPFVIEPLDWNERFTSTTPRLDDELVDHELDDLADYLVDLILRRECLRKPVIHRFIEDICKCIDMDKDMDIYDILDACRLSADAVSKVLPDDLVEEIVVYCIRRY